jgi:hypothetical protein
MTDSKKFWIADVDGVKAVVAGTAARDEWVKVHGWTETTEPVGQEFQWVRNADHGGKGVLNHEAALLHEGLGWFPSGPNGYDEPEEPAEPEPPAPTKSAAKATSGDKKE